MALPVADTTAIVPAVILNSALPVAAVALDGGSSTLGDGAAITGWAWTLIDGPTGHGASLQNPTTQIPNLINVDTWGTYVIQLVVTNDIAQVSESDPLLMPDISFVYVRVSSATLAIQAPGYYQRNTRNELTAWAAALETLKTDFDAARKLFTALDPRIIDVEAAGNHSLALCAWKIPVAGVVTEATITMRDGGTIAGGGYTAVLYHMTTAQFLANDFAGATTITSIAIPAPAADNQAVHVTVSGLTSAITATRVLALRITAAPAAALALGQGLTATVAWRHG